MMNNKRHDATDKAAGVYTIMYGKGMKPKNGLERARRFERPTLTLAR